MFLVLDASFECGAPSTLCRCQRNGTHNCLYFSLFVCLPICLSACLFVCLSVCLSVSLSVWFFIIILSCYNLTSANVYSTAMGSFRSTTVYIQKRASLRARAYDSVCTYVLLCIHGSRRALTQYCTGNNVL